MDYFEGPTLHDYVAENGPLAVDDAVTVATMIAEGLQAAHAKGILHRDIKPGNLLVRGDQPVWQVKVIDFGLAMRGGELASTARSQCDNTVTGESIAGTIDYAAPEQMGRLAGVPVGRYSDVYGFGKTCCYALFQTPQPTWQHWKLLAPPLAELLSKCLEEDPTQRPQDFTAVLSRLQNLHSKHIQSAVVVEDDIPVARLAPPERTPRHTQTRRASRTTSRLRRDDDEPRTRRAPPRKRRRRTPWFALIALATIVVALAWWLFPTWRPNLFTRNAVPPFFPAPSPPAQPLAAADIPGAVTELKTANENRQIELVRRLKVTPLDESQHKSVAETLESLLLTPNRVRPEAITALSVWGRKESGPPLIKLVNDNDGNVRETAMKTLGALKITDAIDAIVGRVPDGWDQSRAVAALRLMGPAAEKQTIPLLKRNDCRRAVSSLLKDIGTKESLPALQEVAVCGNHFDEQAAREAIKSLGGIASWEPLNSAEIPGVLKSIQSSTPADQSALLRRLGIGTPAPEWKPQVVAVLNQFAASEEPMLRNPAIRGLVHWGAIENLKMEDLFPLARDRDENIRNKVISELARTKDPRAAEVIATGLEDIFQMRFAAERLKDMGSAAEKAVIPYLTKGNIHNQGTACGILGAIGTRASVEELQRLARDNHMLRRSAEDALRSLGVLQANEVGCVG